MNYSEPLLHQYNNFLVFLGVGFLLGFAYEAVVFVRALFSKKRFAIIIQDVAFCFLAFLVLFVSFLAFSNGNIRFNLLLSCALGFLTFELTAGRAVKRLFGFLIKAFQKTADVLLKPFAALAAFASRRAKKTKTALKSAVGRAKEKKEVKTEQRAKKKITLKAKTENQKAKPKKLSKATEIGATSNKRAKKLHKRKTKSKIHLKK